MLDTYEGDPAAVHHQLAGIGRADTHHQVDVELLVGGSFTHVDGVAAARIARFDGTTWSPLGTGLPSTVRAIARTATTTYASTYDEGAGFFLLAAFDGTSQTWTELATPAANLTADSTHSVESIVPTPDGTQAVLDAWLVADALTGLSAEHRAVVVGAYYGGRSVAELARENQIPEGTVKSRLHYGLRALRLALQERGVTS